MANNTSSGFFFFFFPSPDGVCTHDSQLSIQRETDRLPGCHDAPGREAGCQPSDHQLHQEVISFYLFSSHQHNVG